MISQVYKDIYRQPDKRERGSRSGLAERVILVLTFKICLDVATVLVSAQALGRYSIDLDYSLESLVVGYLATLFLAVSLPPGSRRIDSFIIWLLVLFLGIPMIIPFQWSGADTNWMMTGTLFLGLLCLQSRVRLVSIRPFEIFGGWWLLGLFFACVTGYSLASGILTVGLTPTFDFSLVYVIRDRFIEQNIPFATYAYKWTAFIVVPFLFMIGMKKGRKSISAAAIGISVVLFFASGHKMYLLIPGFVYLIDWCARKSIPARWLVAALSLVIVAGTVTFYSVGDRRLNATFSNRLYVLPAKISYEYHEFFSNNPKIKLSHSILSRSYDYPYAASPASLISGRYYANPEGSPNTGILADAYMNFGYAGVAGLWFLVAISLRVFHWLARDRDSRLVLSLMIVPVFTWVNSGFLTSYLTSGLALGLIGALCLPTISSRQGHDTVARVAAGAAARS